MNLLSQGVPANSTMREISLMTGEINEDSDIISIVLESLSMPEVL